MAIGHGYEEASGEVQMSLWNKLPRMQPIDMIASLALLICGALKYNGADGTVNYTLALIIGYYFGNKGK